MDDDDVDSLTSLSIPLAATAASFKFMHIYGVRLRLIDSSERAKSVKSQECCWRSLKRKGIGDFNFRETKMCF